MPRAFGHVRSALLLALACVALPIAARAGPPFQTDDPDPTAYRNIRRSKSTTA